MLGLGKERYLLKGRYWQTLVMSEAGDTSSLGGEWRCEESHVTRVVRNVAAPGKPWL